MNRDPASTEALAKSREVDALCDRFEQAWRRGDSVRIEDWLPTDGPQRAAALPELVRIEIELRRRAGQAVGMEEYFARFPVLRTAPTAQWLDNPLRSGPTSSTLGRTGNHSVAADLPVSPPSAVRYPYEVRNCRFVKDIGGPGGIIDFRGKTLTVADSFLSAGGWERPCFGRTTSRALTW